MFGHSQCPTVMNDVSYTTQSLESDLSDARQGLREAKKQEAAAKEAASVLKANLDANVALVARLESDLETHLQGIESTHLVTHPINQHMLLVPNPINKPYQHTLSTYLNTT